MWIRLKLLLSHMRTAVSLAAVMMKRSLQLHDIIVTLSLPTRYVNTSPWSLQEHTTVRTTKAKTLCSRREQKNMEFPARYTRTLSSQFPPDKFEHFWITPCMINTNLTNYGEVHSETAPQATIIYYTLYFAYNRFLVASSNWVTINFAALGFHYAGQRWNHNGLW